LRYVSVDGESSEGEEMDDSGGSNNEESDEDSGGDDMEDSDEEESDDDVDEDSDDDLFVEDEIIMESFIRNFHTGDIDNEFDNALSLDRGTPLLALPKQASYIKPDNWRERNRIGLTKVKEQLQSYIRTLTTYHRFELKLKHNRGWGPQLIDNEEPIVWHDPILDEYWDRLEAKMKQQKKVIDIFDIDIQNVEMKKERLAALVAMIISGRATNSSTYSSFNNANLCEEGIISLSKLVDVSSNLKYLYLKHNRIDNMQLAQCLSKSLKAHTRIHELFLNHCDLGSSPEILSVILQSDIRQINLEHNNIDSLGAVKIAEYLESDPPICRIDLGHNQLNDDDALLMSHALKKNKNLRQIDFRSNNFTSIGVKALLTCVFDSSSLNAISESNHTLTEMNFFDDTSSAQDERLNGCIKRLLELDLTQKIMLALQDKDSLLQYLANVPVELIPEVLAFPLRRDVNQCQHEHLNIVYSTMRWWNMPLLYSYHHGDPPYHHLEDVEEMDSDDDGNESI
jgi:hypothetical protein